MSLLVSTLFLPNSFCSYLITDPQEILTEILHMKEVKAAKTENYSPEPKTQTPTISTPELLCLLFGFSHSFIALCTPVPQLPTLFLSTFSYKDLLQIDAFPEKPSSHRFLTHSVFLYYPLQCMYCFLH